MFRMPSAVKITGRTSTIKHLLEQLDHNQPQLKDICYVHNFKNEDAGKGISAHGFTKRNG